MTSPSSTFVEDRALSLLGSGASPESVATALGVTASRISQLLSNEAFAEQVAALRYKNLQQYNERDESYNNIEDALITKLRASLPLLMRPRDILGAIKVINGATRRGQAAPEQVTDRANIVTLLMPTQIVNKFTTNITNQVVSAGEQDLTTMQSGTLLTMTEDTKKEDKVETATKELAYEVHTD